LRPLARRAGEDLEARFERVIRVDQFELGRTAAEQRLEQALEMTVDRVESFEQPLAALAVQIGDALAKPDDRFLDVGLLPLHLLELG